MTHPNRRILCVDDNEDTCFMLRTLLGRSNYIVKTADGIEDALRLARSELFDLYILDKRFPDGAGVDLCRKLRELNPDARIIFYSGDAYESDRQEALQAGAQAYLTKPYIDRLTETVHSLLADKTNALI